MSHQNFNRREFIRGTSAALLLATLRANGMGVSILLQSDE